MAMARRRLMKEIQALNKRPPAYIRACPLESNILEFHYVFEGPPNTPYFGGYYHGALMFPSEYPLKPPSVMMFTPSGRFQTNTKVCMSMSDFHPESWNPVWSVSTILVGLLSFMLEDTRTVGSVETTDEQKRQLAAASLATNVRNPVFCSLFPALVRKAADEQRARDALDAEAAAAAGSGSSGGATGTEAAAGPVRVVPGVGGGQAVKLGLVAGPGGGAPQQSSALKTVGIFLMFAALLFYAFTVRDYPDVA